jgi:alpha-glucosidase
MSTRFAQVSLIAVVAALASVGAQAAVKTVSSPDGRIQVSVEYGDGGMTYAVSRDGKAIISPSPLGLRTDRARWDRVRKRLKIPPTARSTRPSSLWSARPGT